MVSHPLRMRKALGSNPSVSIFAAAQKKTRVAFGSRRADLLHSSAPSPMQGLSFMNCGQDWQVGGRVSLRLGIKFKRSPPRGWRKAHPVQISSSRLHACRNCLALVASKLRTAILLRPHGIARASARAPSRHGASACRGAFSA